MTEWKLEDERKEKSPEAGLVNVLIDCFVRVGAEEIAAGNPAFNIVKLNQAEFAAGRTFFDQPDNSVFNFGNDLRFVIIFVVYVAFAFGCHLDGALAGEHGFVHPGFRAFPVFDFAPEFKFGNNFHRGGFLLIDPFNRITRAGTGPGINQI